MHPLFVVTRNRETGELVKVARVPSHLGISSGDTAAMPNLSHLIAQGDNASHMESWIAVEIDRVDEAKRAAAARGPRPRPRRCPRRRRGLAEDAQQGARDRGDLDKVANAAQIAELRQAQELLRWLDDGNFTFLGYREYDLVNESGEDVLELREDSGLGLLRDGADTRHQIQHLTETGRKKAREKRALVITKANSRSTVHRSAYLDYIGVKSFDAAGNVNGERRFIGLFATTAYAGSVRDIPVVREKVAAVLRDAGFPPDSHSGKDLLGILETYPRDELFQIEIPDLAAIATGIQRLQERRRTRLFLRPDIYGRFMSAVVYLPRDRYTTNVRLRIEEELRETFDAVSIDYEARMTESALARLFFRIRLPKDADVSHVNSDELEKRLVRAARSWSEGIAEVLRARAAPTANGAKELAAVWAEAFPASYRVDYEVEDALEDIARFEKYGAAAERAGEAARNSPASTSTCPTAPARHLEEDARVKLYMLEPKSLSQILPYFHNLGLEVLDERPVRDRNGRPPRLLPLRPRPEVPGRRRSACHRRPARRVLRRGRLRRRWSRTASTGWCCAKACTGARWSCCAPTPSTCGRWATPTPSSSCADTLLANPDVTRGLTALFAARFDPALSDGERDSRQDEVRAEPGRGHRAGRHA